MTGRGPTVVTVTPAEWALAPRIEAAAATALSRLDPPLPLAACDLVADALAADDRAWFLLKQAAGGWRLQVWFHPDQVLQDRPGRGAAAPGDQDWRLGPVPPAVTRPPAEEFSLPNTLRFLHQQFMVVGDLIDRRLEPSAVPAGLVEAFQEAWLITVDGRLQRLGLPHLSAAQRRASFLRLFAPAGIVTPSHWAVFNTLWDGTASTQAEVLQRIRLLPTLTRRRRG
jgi:hypothetical protein